MGSFFFIVQNDNKGNKNWKVVKKLARTVTHLSV